ncbi:MAG: hypothetical protein ACLUDU_02255 [Butyricimonas faecihominis]
MWGVALLAYADNCCASSLSNDDSSATLAMRTGSDETRYETGMTTQISSCSLNYWNEPDG